MIKLHPLLEKDCIIFGEFKLSALLLLNDANYPWFVLVPKRENITELHQLSSSDQQQLLKESMFFSECMEQLFQPDKLNIAALGNVVPQLHIHHIARYTSDACWPQPVWGKVVPILYTEKQLNHMRKQVFSTLSAQTDVVFQQI